MPQIVHYYYNTVSHNTFMSQLLEQSRNPKSTKNLVESFPVRGIKLPENPAISWTDLMGLTWLLVDD